MISNPAARVRILSGPGQYTIRLRSLHRAHPSLHPFGVVHWVPEQLNIKAVTVACKLIDGCSLELCSATTSVVSSGICHGNKVNSTAWLLWWPCHEIESVTFTYIYINFPTFSWFRTSLLQLIFKKSSHCPIAIASILVHLHWLTIFLWINFKIATTALKVLHCQSLD